MNYLLRISLPPFETQSILVSTSHRLQACRSPCHDGQHLYSIHMHQNDWLIIFVGRGPNYSFCVFFPNIHHCEEILVYQKLHRRNGPNRRFLCCSWTWGRVLSREMRCAATHCVLLPPVVDGGFGRMSGKGKWGMNAADERNNHRLQVYALV